MVQGNSFNKGPGYTRFTTHSLVPSLKERFLGDDEIIENLVVSGRLYTIHRLELEVLIYIIFC